MVYSEPGEIRLMAGSVEWCKLR